MRPTWGDLIARSRGLSTHLLRRAQLAALARAPDLPALAADLARLGFPVEPEAVSPALLELAVRRRAAAGLRVLARWAASRSDLLAVVFEDEDRRSLRTILRGIAQRASPEARLADLLPSPALPERALQELSRQPSPAAVATLLTLWNHPYGAALRVEAARAEPDLMGLEVCLNRTFAERALAGARRAERRAGALLSYVRETIDLENAFSAMVLAGEGDTHGATDFFLPGGIAISRASFEAARQSGSSAFAARKLAGAFAGPLAKLLRQAPAGDIERLVLSAQIDGLHRHVLHDPLSPASVLHYALRLRAQLLDLRHIIWGVSLAVPPPTLESELVASR